MEKEDKKKQITWEAADPKLPVVRSGHLENRRQYQEGPGGEQNRGVM